MSVTEHTPVVNKFNDKIVSPPSDYRDVPAVTKHRRVQAALQDLSKNVDYAFDNSSSNNMFNLQVQDTGR